MTESVQIILPVYNGNGYLHEAIASVFSQTIPDWNLILVDDGSIDGSREALRDYTDPRVRVVLNRSNYGLYGSLVRVIKELPPAWVVIVMQDDRLKPNYLETMLALTKKEIDCTAFWAAIDEIDENGRLVSKGLDTGRLEMIRPGVEAWIGALRRGCVWTISGSFTHANLLREHVFKENYPHCGDYDWLLRILLHAPMVYYERPVIEIRIHPRAASTKNLSSGIDVSESYAIVRENCHMHANRIGRAEVFAICRIRAALTLRRAAGAVWQGRIKAALLFLRYSLRFATLPLIYSWGRKDAV